MPLKTITSKEFNQHASQAQKAADQGPVIITSRGKPAHVLLTIQEYQKLTYGQRKITDLLAMPGSEDINLEIPKIDDPAQVADLS